MFPLQKLECPQEEQRLAALPPLQAPLMDRGDLTGVVAFPAAVLSLPALFAFSRDCSSV
jgi:hypothetical protein